MTYITESEEALIDAGKSVVLEREDKTFYVAPEYIRCYGEIDFHNNSDDMNTISTFDWLNCLTLCGISIPANYDYEKHCAYSDEKYIKTFDTVFPDKVAQYGHGCMNKPKRTIIFKYPEKSKYNHICLHKIDALKYFDYI